MSLIREIMQPFFDLVRATSVQPVPDEELQLDLRHTTPHEAVLRALELVGKPSRYRLGGGANVKWQTPFDVDGTCDCSGFTGHVTGHNRIQHVAGKRVSYYTDNVVRDAWKFSRDQWRMRGKVTPEGPQKLYLPVTRAMPVRIGDLIVRPGKYSPIGPARRIKIGHIGIITSVGDGFFENRKPGGDWFLYLGVVHCTPNRGRESSVVKTNARGWRKRAYIVRPRWYA